MLNDPFIGTVIDGRIEILGLLGRGGMGTVYEAFHTGLQTSVAVKVLNPTVNVSQEIIRRFQSEARIASSIQHPNVVITHSFGLLPNDVPYIVMEKLEGVTLATYLTQHKVLEMPMFLAVFKQCIEGIRTAHERGIVHRDIKPSNIVLLEQGDGSMAVKVADFGIAKDSVAVVQHLTQTGEVLGTPVYMSPEQCEAKALDHRSDIYSLGCVMYEALSGRPPFQADSSFEMMMKHSHEEPEPIEKLRPELRNHRAILDVVAHTLKKSLDARPQTVVRLLEELNDAERGISPLPGRTFKPPKWARQAAAVGLTISLVLAIAAFTGSALESKDNEATALARKESQAKQSAAERFFIDAEAARNASKNNEATLLYQRYLTAVYGSEAVNGKRWKVKPEYSSPQYIAHSFTAARQFDELSINGHRHLDHWYQALNALEDSRSPLDLTDATVRDIKGECGWIEKHLHSMPESYSTDYLKLAGRLQLLLGDHFQSVAEGKNGHDDMDAFIECANAYKNAAVLAEKFARMTGFKVENRSILYGNLATALLKTGHPEEAKVALLQALDPKRQDWNGTREFIAKRKIRANEDLARIYMETGELRSAKRSYQDALKICSETLVANANVDRREMIIDQVQLEEHVARIEMYSGNLTAAVEGFKRTLDHANREPDINASLTSELEIDLAYCLLESGDTKHATKVIQTATSWAKDHPNKTKAIDVTAMMEYINGRISEQQGKTAAAQQSYASALSRMQTIGALTSYHRFFMARQICLTYEKFLQKSGNKDQLELVRKINREFADQSPILAKAVSIAQRKG